MTSLSRNAGSAAAEPVLCVSCALPATQRNSAAVLKVKKCVEVLPKLADSAGEMRSDALTVFAYACGWRLTLCSRVTRCNSFVQIYLST